MTLKRINVFIWTVLFVAWFFDFLFWGKVPGVSFPIFVTLVLIAGFFLARQQGLAPAKMTLWLLAPIAYFAVMFIVRLESMTSFLNLAACLALLGVFAHSFMGGKWWQYTFRDYLVGNLKLGVDSLVRPIAILSAQPKEPESDQVKTKPKLGTSLAILRGLLLAIPIILIFAAMLSEADPIFGQQLEKFFAFLNIENLGEYIVRGILIAIIAYLLLGVYLHAFYKNHDETLSSEENRLVPRFLGFTEVAVVLSSVNLLFISFVGVQFKYFFGGEQNIHLDGFTYAEYARRGFGELVAVAVFSLLLFIGLSVLLKKTGARQELAFSVMGIFLVSLVCVILVSSFKRLLLYEQAYGFTRLRAYTHVFIIWLGILLVAVILLEIVKRQQFFALAAAVAAVGFVVSLGALNVDGFIVRQNVARALQGEHLDIGYLASLSEDAVPLLAELYRQAQASGQLEEGLRGALACHADRNDQYDYQKYPWQSFHLARFHAFNTWNELVNAESQSTFAVSYPDDNNRSIGSYVMVNGEQVNCWSNSWD